MLYVIRTKRSYLSSMPASRVNRLSLVPYGELTVRQVNDLRTWISGTGELHLISGEKGPLLDEPTLTHWIRSSASSHALVNGREVIGLATLSTSEVGGMPPDTIECCHLIVHPKHRRKYCGTLLLAHLSARAKELGYRRIVGRVVRSNSVGRDLLRSLGWHGLAPEEFGNWPNGQLDWYEKRFDHERKEV